MNKTSDDPKRRYFGRPIDQFLLILAGSAIVATFLVLYLLNFEHLGRGNIVVLAGLGGIVGTSLAPLLEQRSEKDFEGLTGAETAFPILTQLLIHVVGGFGFAAAAFVVTTALLIDEPGRSTSALGTAAFGSGIGFFIGRVINGMSPGWTSNETRSLPAVVTALGEFEDQLFGRRLLNYDGDVVANWRVSSTSSDVMGQLLVQMVARNVRQGLSEVSSPGAVTGTKPSLSPRKARVLIQGGQDADLVPFAISVISSTFNVQPHRLILAAPSKGTSETLEFTMLNIRQDEEEKNIVTKKVPPGADIADTSPASPRPSTFPILIDVSQAGRTIQLFEMEVPYS